MRRSRASMIDQMGAVVTAVLILVGVVTMLMPIIITVSLSLSETFAFPPTGLTLRWYENFLGRRDFTDGLQVSFILALATVVLATSLGTGVALGLTRRSFWGKAAANFFFLSPIVLPKVAIGVAIFLFFITLGIRDAAPRLLIVHVLMATPYVVAVVVASLQGIDPKLEEAALNLGASPIETFRRVIFPLIRPAIVTGAVFAFIVSFDEVTASIFLIDIRTSTFPIVLFSYLARGATDPTVAAASSFMLLFVLLIVGVLARYVGLAKS